MSEQNKTLVPKSRFPEFQDDWAAKKLGELGTLSGGGTPDKSVTEYWQGDIPWVSSSDIYEDDIYTLTVTRFINEKSISESATKIVPKGSVLFVSRVGTGKLAVNDRDVCTSQDFMNFKPKKVFSYFLGYFFIANKSALVSLGQGTSIKGFSKGDLEKLKVSFPSVPEQQKIADCLSSIDELITAQTNKIAALKEHKKGLMQQLFPAEGETTPQRRFPEFQNAEEWEETRLGNVGSVRMCKRIFKEQTSSNGDIPFYKIGTFGGVPDAYISREIFENFRNNFPFPKKGSVLISAAGTIGRTIRYKGELAYFQDSNIVWLDNNENVIADNFLFYLYQLINWAPSVGAIQRLYNESILGTHVKFPTLPEQQEIAACLTSVDDLITEQTQKLEALKTHKNGLMQQLFPSANEVAV